MTPCGAYIRRRGELLRAIVKTNNIYYHEIADAIRLKNGEYTQYSPAEWQLRFLVSPQAVHP